MADLRVRGQMRAVEAIVLAALVVGTLGVLGYMLTSPNPLAARQERELEEECWR